LREEQIRNRYNIEGRIQAAIDPDREKYFGVVQSKQLSTNDLAVLT